MIIPLSTGVNFVCWNGSAASIGASAADCGGSAGVVGCVAQDPNARYIRGGTGAEANLGRNTFESPGINTANISFFKNTPVWGDDKMIQFRIEVWNVANHPNFTIGHGSVFQTTGNATGLPNYVTPGTGQFLDNEIFSGGLGQAPFQRVIQWGLKFIF